MRSNDEYTQAILDRINDSKFDDIEEINFCGHKDYRLGSIKFVVIKDTHLSKSSKISVMYDGIDITNRMTCIDEIKESLLERIRLNEEDRLEGLFNE
jgi:hypothetical protein